MLKGPVFKSLDIIRHLKKEAFGDLPALNAVFHAKITALVMIVRIESAGIIRAGAKRS
jgi:hypothetical protein